MPSLPTEQEEYAKLMEALRKGQEASAMLAHLVNSQPNRGTTRAKGWMAVSEALKLMQHNVIQIATGKLNS
jgi:hypothetical protein